MRLLLNQTIFNSYSTLVYLGQALHLARQNRDGSMHGSLKCIFTNKKGMVPFLLAKEVS